MTYSRLVRTVAIALTAVVLLFTTTSARADSPDPAALKATADAAFDGRSYARALDDYRAALAAGGDPRIHYNVAQTLTALERYPEALTSYQTFLTEAPTGTLTAAQQEKFFVLLEDLKARITRVEVTCDVSGARVLVRDKAVGETSKAGPLAVSINSGPAKIEVLAEGFRPFVTTIDLPGGAVRRVPVALERVDFTGALLVKGNVPDATVTIDGAERGAPPVAIRLERGTHTLVMKAASYVEQSETIEIEAGGKREVTFTLQRAPDYTLSYVGVAVGGVGIAAGAVMGILAFTSLGDAKKQCDTVNKECGPAAQAGLVTSKTYGTLSTIGFGVGIAGAGLAIGSFVAVRGGREPARPVNVVLMPNGLSARGTF
jgi:hypothetical protein